MVCGMKSWLPERSSFPVLLFTWRCLFYLVFKIRIEKIKIRKNQTYQGCENLGREVLLGNNCMQLFPDQTNNPKYGSLPFHPYLFPPKEKLYDVVHWT